MDSHSPQTVLTLSHFQLKTDICFYHIYRTTVQDVVSEEGGKQGKSSQNFPRFLTFYIIIVVFLWNVILTLTESQIFAIDIWTEVYLEVMNSVLREEIVALS